MNKYTLEFQNILLEHKYQGELKQSLIYFYKYFSCGVLIVLISNWISDISQQSMTINYLKIFITLEISLSIVIIKYYPNYVSYGIFLLNAMISLFQFNLVEQDSQLIFNSGQSVMCAQCMIILIGDFQNGFLSSLTTLCIRIIALTLKSENIGVCSILLAVIAHCLLIFSLYLKCSYQRNVFLLSQREQLYETLIPQFFNKTVFWFTFNQERFGFQLMKAYHLKDLENQEKPLNYFLQNAKYGQLSLELFLYNQIRNNTQMNCNLRVKYQKQLKQIQVITLSLEVQTYLIVFNDEKDQMKIEQRMANFKQKVMGQMKKLINLQFQFFKYSNKKQIIECLNLLLSMKQVKILSKGEHEFQKFHKISFNKLLKNYQQQFVSNNLPINITVQQNIMIYCNIFKLKLLLLHIFRASPKHHTQNNIQIKVDVNSQDQIIINCNFCVRYSKSKAVNSILLEILDQINYEVIEGIQLLNVFQVPNQFSVLNIISLQTLKCYSRLDE